MSQFFLQPQLLFGMLLVSVPILIYLFQRHRYRRRRWAAMEFLLRAVKRHQKRIQLQNLLLLLIRCAILFFLALAMARPVFRTTSLGGVAGDDRNWILAIDASYSMSYDEDNQSLFDAARDSLLKVAETLIDKGNAVAVMTFERQPRVLVPRTIVTDAFASTLRTELERLSLSSDSVDLGASFAVLEELSNQFVTDTGDPEAKRIVLFSDLQRKDWLTGDEPRYPGVRQFIDKLQADGGQISLAVLGPGAVRPNLALADLSVAPTVVARDVWVELSATVQNFGDTDIDNVDLTIQVDPDLSEGAAEPQLGHVVRVPAHGFVTRTMRYRFDRAGDHSVVAELRSDGLGLDNKRFLVTNVAEAVRVLLVDGDPGTDPLDAETFHLQLALAAEDDSMASIEGRLTPFEPLVVQAEQLSDVELDDFSLIVCANVGSFARADVKRMQAFVKGGGLLLGFFGDRVQADLYHELFHEEGGESLLPVRLGDVRGDPAFPIHLGVSDGAHPLAKYFHDHATETDLHRPLASFTRYFAVEPLLEESRRFRISHRYTDAEKTPALFDAAYGRGRVFWVNATADQAWTDLSDYPDFVILLHETINYLMTFRSDTSNLRVGMPFARVYPAEEFASEVTLQLPIDFAGLSGGERIRNAHKTMRQDETEKSFRILHEDTAIPGIYRLDLRRPHSPEEDTVEYFCANVEGDEGDLTRLEEDDLRRVYDNLKFQALDVEQRLEDVAEEQSLARGREFWRAAIAAVLALLVCESVLAWLFGRRAV